MYAEFFVNLSFHSLATQAAVVQVSDGLNLAHVVIMNSVFTHSAPGGSSSRPIYINNAITFNMVNTSFTNFTYQSYVVRIHAGRFHLQAAPVWTMITVITTGMISMDGNSFYNVYGGTNTMHIQTSKFIMS